MFKLRRWYNQNRKVIWRVVTIIIFLILMLQVFNYFAKINNNKQTTYENKTEISDITKKYNDVSVSDDKSVVSQQKMSISQINSLEVINNFFKYCNEKNIKDAYNLITDECKKELYPTLEKFKNNYYKPVFENSKKEVSVENWINDIYKIKISDDFLSSGKYSKDNTKQDYITIKEEGEDIYKLNINGYIGGEELNKESEQKDVNIKVIRKNTYMDYETYTFKVTNKSKKNILIDSLQNINSMYIEDKSGMKYSAYTHEIALPRLVVTPEKTQEITIKYYSKYGSEKEIKAICFSKIFLDYDINNIMNSAIYGDYCEIKIDL